jgi:hypothetical protein
MQKARRDGRVFAVYTGQNLGAFLKQYNELRNRIPAIWVILLNSSLLLVLGFSPATPFCPVLIYGVEPFIEQQLPSHVVNSAISFAHVFESPELEVVGRAVARDGLVDVPEVCGFGAESPSVPSFPPYLTRTAPFSAHYEGAPQ